MVCREPHTFHEVLSAPCAAWISVKFVYRNGKDPYNKE